MTYGVAKELARILKPLVGKFIHYVNNNKVFIKQIENLTLEEGKCITLYDVTALFTSVQVEPAIKILKMKLEQDTEPYKRTNMSSYNIRELT